jgi:autotransporter-associated beta strand protein
MLRTLLCGLLLATPLWAQSTWNTTTGNWNTAGNWLSGVAPTGTDITHSLTFGGTGTYTATNNFTPVNAPAFYLNSLNLSGSANITLAATGTFPAAQSLRFIGDTNTVTYSSTGNSSLILPLGSYSEQSMAITKTAGSGTLVIGTTAESGLSGLGTYVLSDNSATAMTIGGFTDNFGGTLIVAAGTVTTGRTSGSETVFGNGRMILQINSGATFNMLNYDSDGGFGLQGAGTLAISGADFAMENRENLTWSGQITGTSVSGLLLRAGLAGSFGTYTWTGDNSFTAGSINIRNGTLQLSGGGRLSGNFGTLNLTSGAMLDLDNATTNLVDRVRDANAINLGGVIRLIGNLSGSTETIGAITMGTSGRGMISVQGSTSTLTAASLTTRASRGQALEITGDGTVTFTTLPTLTNSIIPSVVVNRSTVEWATLSGSNLVGLATYETSTNPSDWATTENVKVNATTTSTATRTINSLHVNAPVTVAINAGSTLTTTHGIIAAASGTISGGTIVGNQAGSVDELLIYAAAGTNLTINSVIGNTPTQGVNIFGRGTVTLGGTNTFNSTLTVQGGATLQVGTLANLGAGNAISLFDGVLRVTGNVTSPATVTLRSERNEFDIGSNTVSFATVTDAESAGGFTLRGNGGTLISTFGGVNGDVTVMSGATLRATATDALNNDTLLTLNTGATFDDSFGNSENFGGLAGNGTYLNRNDAIDSIILLGNKKSTFSGRIRSALNGVVTVGGPGNFRIGSNLTELTLSGTTSDYGGATIVSAGTLIVTQSAAQLTNGPLGNSSTAVLLGDTVDNNRSFARFLIGDAAVDIARDVIVLNTLTPDLGFGVVAVGSNHTTGISAFSGFITINRSLELTVSGSATTTFTGLL